MARQVGHVAWRWDPSNLEAAGGVTARLGIDGVHHFLSHIGDDAVLVIVGADDNGHTVLPGDWIARSPDGDWSVIDNPDHASSNALAEALAEVTRQRATIGRLMRLHNGAVAECRSHIRIAELGAALNQPPDGHATGGDPHTTTRKGTPIQ